MPESIEKQEISVALPNLFLIFAQDVIQNRAINRIEDGLKPVQRRIIYSMYKQHLFNNREYVKSAKTVGDVISKYHAHG